MYFIYYYVITLLSLYCRLVVECPHVKYLYKGRIIPWIYLTRNKIDEYVTTNLHHSFQMFRNEDIWNALL